MPDDARPEEPYRQVAQAAARLLKVIYEFEDSVDDMYACMQEPIEALHDLLIPLGHMPPHPPPPTEEQIHAWIRERVIANGGTPIPEIMPSADGMAKYSEDAAPTPPDPPISFTRDIAERRSSRPNKPGPGGTGKRFSGRHG